MAAVSHQQKANRKVGFFVPVRPDGAAICGAVGALSRPGKQVAPLGARGGNLKP